MANQYPDWAGFAIGTATCLLGMRSAISLAIRGKSIEGWTSIEGKLDELETRLEKHIGYETTVITARYSYVYQGSHYLGSRVSALEDSPRLWSGPYGSEAIRLHEALKSNGPLRLYVNSANPRESVLLRFPMRPYWLRSIVLFALGISILALDYFSAARASSILIGVTLGFTAYVIVMSWNQGKIRL